MRPGTGSTRARGRRIQVTVLVCVAVLAPISGVATAADAARPAPIPQARLAGGAAAGTIDGCTAITSPGRYVLAGNLSMDGSKACVRVTAPDVVIDGAGHSIAAADTASRFGVLARNTTNVTVRDLTVTGANISGIAYHRVSIGRVQNTTTRGSRSGVWLWHTDNVTVSGVDSTGNAYAGIKTETAVDGAVVHNTVSENLVGVFVARSIDTEVARNTASRNLVGIAVTLTERSSITRNALSGNTKHGISVARSNRSSVTGNEADTSTNGIRLFRGFETRITGNTVRDTDDGLYLERSGRNVMSGNRIDAGVNGIHLTRSSDGNRIRRNAIRSDDTGIAITLSAGNAVIGNSIHGGADGTGIVTASTSDTTIIDNRVGTHPEPAGIDAPDRTGRDDRPARIRFPGITVTLTAGMILAATLVVLYSRRD